MSRRGRSPSHRWTTEDGADGDPVDFCRDCIAEKDPVTGVVWLPGDTDAPTGDLVRCLTAPAREQS